jgi:predicted  nucleic acid-binding Zn-ribbon protein
MELLIALQDLLQLKRDLQDQSYERIGFETGGEAAIDTEIESLRAEIDRAVLRRFDRIATKYDRPLVPVRNGVCYGCFVQYPTAKIADLGDALTTCESCGRLLYRIP